MTNSNRITDADGNLAPRVDLFCRELIVDFIGAKAAVRAGFPEKSAKVRACEMLADERVQARVAELMAERAARAGISADWVVSRLKAVAERCLQETPVMRDGKPLMVETPTGQVAAAYTFDAAGANKALDLLGRHVGIFEADNRQRSQTVVEEIIRALDERDGGPVSVKPDQDAVTRH